jgi:hypothetical protein
MIYEPYEDSTAKRISIVLLVAIAGLVGVLLLFGCATAKPCPPCPPVEIVRVEVPGPVVPCPAPPAITPPQLWLLDLSASGATIQEIATALEHDRQELLRVLAEYQAVLEVYRPK